MRSAALSIEAPTRIEPCLLDEAGAEIVDLVASLSAAAAALGSRLHPRSAAGLADAVRIMNCYYSNLIEGHNTTPREIEAALQGQLESTPERRDLQLEARAHIRVQREIDRQHAAGTLGDPASVEFIRWLHREFYADAPEAMLTVKSGELILRMTPGEFRSDPTEEVTVGRHLPPSPGAVGSFMAHFEQRYRLSSLGRGSRIIAMAAAHHRLNYIHPFLDGNGRVSRLMSHAMALHAGIGAHGLWSVSRGLARGAASRGDYKRMMDYADMPRQGDLDGRGNLSRKALVEFTTWFLKVCQDQVTFMAKLFALETLVERLRLYAERHGWRPEAWLLLERVLQQGEVPRGDAPRITSLKERSARELLSVLVDDGILGSDTPKGPVSLRFPMQAIELLFPSLFPET
ncbi:Fic family protein [Roseomonas stagni]|uniref:Fic family protein n=1 Tax=Falsiroseomonas algicola TaxID=2716930 RepID=A0A6M1LWA5_9PROT|nr:Fic family protein [Falsiroseomonas algicola]NGM24299.1 Fic family protein [Falsiroseomonas algicola]